MKRRLVEVPDWFDGFVVVATRLSMRRAIDALHDFGIHVNAIGSAAPHRLIVDPPPRVRRMLVPFLVAAGLAMPGVDDVLLRGQRRCRRRVGEVPAGFRDGVAAFASLLEQRRDRARRLGLRINSIDTDISQLSTVRDLALFCAPTRGGWASIGRVDVEAFLARRPVPSASELGDLRFFFRWARRQRLVLTNPVDGLRIRQPGSFQGHVLDTATQRVLYQRWTAVEGVDPHEALFGLAALIHGISTVELRHLTIADIDVEARTIRVGRRPEPVPIDPATWAAVERCLAHRNTLRGDNPHLIVNRINASSDRPAGASYFAQLLTPAGVTPTELRCTRLSHLANQVDPVMMAAMFGMTHKAAAYYHEPDADHRPATPTVTP